jgi:hypothetical protein
MDGLPIVQLIFDMRKNLIIDENADSDQNVVRSSLRTPFRKADKPVALIPEGMKSQTGGNPKENTLTVRLLGHLDNVGFSKADFERHFPILKGRPRKPDGAFAYGGKTHLISAKQGKEKEGEAVASAQEYQTLIGETTILGEVFAVVYAKTAKDRNILWTLANRHHMAHSWSLESLEAIANKIQDIVMGKWEEALKEIEPADVSAIRVLSQAVNEISSALVGVSDNRLKAVFGGKDFFDSVLAYELDQDEISGALRRAAGYLLVNQTLFYGILAEAKLYDPIELADASNPSIIKSKYFDRVLGRNYRPIFGVDVCTCLEGEVGQNGALKVVNAIKALIPGLGSNRDIIGNVFHQLIPLSFRKPLGAFFTMPASADFLARLAVDKTDAQVLDPACGSGTLLVAAYRRKKDLLENQDEIPEIHRRFVEEDLTGIDVMAFVAHLAAVHLALQEPLIFTNEVRIGVEDSTTKKPGDMVDVATTIIREGFKQRKLEGFNEQGRVELAPQAYATAGTVNLGEEKDRKPFQLHKVDLVITNPPFTSCSNMALPYRRTIELSFNDNGKYRRCLEGRWSLQIPFILLADMFLETGGRLAAVLPLTTFSGKYFEPIVNFLNQHYSILYIVAGIDGCAFSDDTHITEILLVAEKRTPNPNHKFKLIGLKRGPHHWSNEDLIRMKALASQLRDGHVPPPNDLFIVREEEQSELLFKNSTLPKLVVGLSHAFSVSMKKLEKVLNVPFIASTELVFKRNGWRAFIGKAFRVFKDSPEETGHGLKAYGGAAILFSSTKERTHKEHDRMVVVGRKHGIIQIEDISDGQTFNLPVRETIPYLRRFAGVNKLNADEIVDMTVRRFSRHIEPLLNHVYGEAAHEKSKLLKRDWEKKTASDHSRLMVSYKGNIVTPGMCLLACVTSDPVFVAGDLYGFRGTKVDEEKILALWANSSCYLINLLAERTVTEGSWGRLDKKVLNKLPMLDPRKLSKSQRERLLQIFERFQDVEWPSFLDQFSHKFGPRKQIDVGLLQVLGLNTGDAEALVGLMHEAIREKLEGLANSR